MIWAPPLPSIISIPDDSSTSCATLGLPTLPSGYTYACVSEDDLHNTDGTGWIPINFTDSALAGVITLSSLPIDPTNTTTTGLYYTYIPGGSYELTTILESDKYRPYTDDDGGDSFSVYEKGTNLTLSPYSDSGLVGYWPFEEGTGTTTADESGNGHAGTLTNGPTWVQGKVGSGALQFDGSNDYINISGGDGLKLEGPFTLSVWVFMNEFKSNGYLFVKSSGGGNVTVNYRIITASSSYIDTLIGNGVTTNVLAGNGVTWGVGIDEWNLWTVTADGSNLRFYINGMLKASTTQSITPVGSSHNLTIGGSVGGNSLNGFLDDARIYTRALSASEIWVLYNATR